MPTIETVTRRDIRRTMLLTFVAILIAFAGLYFAFAHFYSHKIASCTVVGFELMAMSFMPAWSAHIARLRKLERSQWLTNYKASPESHILRLND